MTTPFTVKNGRILSPEEAAKIDFVANDERKAALQRAGQAGTSVEDARARLAEKSKGAKK